MDPINKTAMRAAVLIHEQLAGGTRHDLPIYLPEYSWNNIQQLRRQIDLARQRGWHAAAARLTEDLAGALDDCRRELENALRALQSRPTERQVSSASDIYRDILALYDEFEEVDIDLDEHTLSVTTDRIVLEYVTLGPFRDPAGLAASGRFASPIASWPSIPTRPPRATTSPIPTSRMSSFAKAKAGRPSGPRWPSAACTISSCWFPSCSTPTAGAVPTWSWTTGTASLARIAAVPWTRTTATTVNRCDATLCSGCCSLLPGLRRVIAAPIASASALLAATSIALPAWRHARRATSGSAKTAWRPGLCRSCHEKQRNEETRR